DLRGDRHDHVVPALVPDLVPAARRARAAAVPAPDGAGTDRTRDRASVTPDLRQVATKPERLALGWRRLEESPDAAAGQSRRPVPRAGGLESDRPRRRPGDSGPLEQGGRRLHLRRHPRPDGGAAAAAAAAALAAGGGPVRARLPVLARRRGVRPRLPRA